jgi:hypothetical protein
VTSCLVSDLTIIEGEFDSWYRFRWKGPDFLEAVAQIKAVIPKEARSFDELTGFWTVATAFEETLSRIFQNFRGQLEAIRSQTSLFEGAQ